MEGSIELLWFDLIPHLWRLVVYDLVVVSEGVQNGSAGESPADLVEDQPVLFLEKT
jgi:hypothetical protein